MNTTTSHKIVIPFYAYAAVAFLIGTFLLLISVEDITSHYFQPQSLAIVHIMVLGWGTMMVLGASHQLVPVLIEGKLYSNKLAMACFFLAGTGIPLLVYGFYYFEMGWQAQSGAVLICLAIIAYLLNLCISMMQNKNENVHAYFVFTAALWLLITALMGSALVFNFTIPLLSQSALAYLPLHAHLGIVGWFLLLITGVGSRLIPLFLISKYHQPKTLWLIFILINAALIAFVLLFTFNGNPLLNMLPVLAIATALILFGNYCYKSYQQRIRKKVDEQLKTSLLSVTMMIIPVILLIIILAMRIFTGIEHTSLIIVYGFINIFGWITAIILGMTFKTLPFIIWNKVYHQLAGKGKTPGPNELFSKNVYKVMVVIYIAGFITFPAGILLNQIDIIKLAAALLFTSTLLYNWNVIKLLMHKPVTI